MDYQNLFHFLWHKFQKAEKGGFVVTKLENGGYILRNPATVHITVLLENALALLK